MPAYSRRASSAKCSGRDNIERDIRVRQIRVRMSSGGPLTSLNERHECNIIGHYRFGYPRRDGILGAAVFKPG